MIVHTAFAEAAIASMYAMEVMIQAQQRKQRVVKMAHISVKRYPIIKQIIKTHKV